MPRSLPVCFRVLVVGTDDITDLEKHTLEEYHRGRIRLESGEEDVVLSDAELLELCSFTYHRLPEPQEPTYEHWLVEFCPSFVFVTEVNGLEWIERYADKITHFRRPLNVTLEMVHTLQ